MIVFAWVAFSEELLGPRRGILAVDGRDGFRLGSLVISVEALG